MLNKKDNNISIATKLIKVVFSIYFVFAIIITLTQVIVEFNDEKEKILSEISSLTDTMAPLLAEALWEEDTSQLSAGVKGLMNNPNVLGVTIKDDDGKVVIFKNYPSLKNIKISSTDQNTFTNWTENVIPIEFELLYTDGVNISEVGKGIIFTKNRLVLRRVKLTLILTLINAILKTLILWIIIYYTVNRIVTKPLERLTKELIKLSPSTITKIIQKT